MRSTGSWNISICLKFVPSFAQPRKKTTSCHRLYWESSIATRSASRVQKHGNEWCIGRRSHVHNEEASFSQSSAEGRRSGVGAAIPGCDGACLHGSCPNRRGSQAADRLLLYSSRRDHGEHLAW